MIDKAVKLIKRNGVDKTHEMLLNKSVHTDFMSVCSRIIFALDQFAEYSAKKDMLTCARIIDNSGLSAKELISLHEYLICQ